MSRELLQIYDDIDGDFKQEQAIFSGQENIQSTRSNQTTPN
jgi:hypothetical protein